MTLPYFILCVQSLRSAYHESVALGQELSKRINDDPTTGRSHRDNDDDSDWSDHDDNDGGFQTEMGSTQNAKKRNQGSTAARAAKEMNQVLDGEEMPAATGNITHTLDVLTYYLVNVSFYIPLTCTPDCSFHHRKIPQIVRNGFYEKSSGPAERTGSRRGTIDIT